MYTSNFTDKAYHLENCDSYILSIQLALDGFSFSVVQDDNYKIVEFMELEWNTISPFQLKTEMENCLKSNNLTGKQFKKIVISFKNLQQTVVPYSILEPVGFEKAFDFTFEKRVENIILSYQLPNTNEIILFGFPKILHSYMKETFPNITFVPFGIGLLQHRKLEKQIGKHVIVQYHMHFILVSIIEANKVLYHSVNFVKNDLDASYYVLMALNLFELDANANISISGHVYPNSEFIVHLTRHYPSTRFAEPSEIFSFNESQHNSPKHFHSALFEQCLCV